MENTNTKLLDEMIEKRMCISKAEARRILLNFSEEKIREKLAKIKVIKRQPKTRN